MFGFGGSRGRSGQREDDGDRRIQEIYADPVGQGKVDQEYPYFPVSSTALKTRFESDLNGVHPSRWQDAFKWRLGNAVSDDERNAVYSLAFDRGKEAYLQKRSLRSGEYFGDPDDPKVKKRLWDRYQSNLAKAGDDSGKKLAAVTGYFDPFSAQPKMTLKADQIDGIDSVFREKVDRILQRMRAQGYDAYVHEGLRSRTQQRENVRKGVSRTMDSKHLTGKGVDIVSSSKGWDPDPDFWNALGQEAEREGLVWGGNWSELVDKVHVQLP